MSIKGPDDQITGKNNPEASHKSEGFSETFSRVFDHCEWISEEMWDDDQTVSKMENILWDILLGMEQLDLNVMSRRTRAMFIEANAEDIAKELTKRMKQ